MYRFHVCGNVCTKYLINCLSVRSSHWVSGVVCLWFWSCWTLMGKASHGVPHFCSGRRLPSYMHCGRIAERARCLFYAAGTTTDTTYLLEDSKRERLLYHCSTLKLCSN